MSPQQPRAIRCSDLARAPTPATTHQAEGAPRPQGAGGAFQALQQDPACVSAWPGSAPPPHSRQPHPTTSTRSRPDVLPALATCAAGQVVSPAAPACPGWCWALLRAPTNPRPAGLPCGRVAAGTWQLLGRCRPTWRRTASWACSSPTASAPGVNLAALEAGWRHGNDRSRAPAVPHSMQTSALPLTPAGHPPAGAARC